MQVAEAPEHERVYLHRVDAFRRLGYDDLEAEYLAQSGVDWHEIEALLAKGCSLNLAARIVM